MLANNHNNFEEKLRKKFEGAEMTPSADLWSKIDKQLQYEPPQKVTDYRSFYLGAAAAFFICLLSATLYVLIAPQNKINGNFEVKSAVAEKNKNPEPYVEGKKYSEYKEGNKKQTANEAIEKNTLPYNNYHKNNEMLTQQHEIERAKESDFVAPKKEVNQNIVHNTAPTAPNFANIFIPSESKNTQNVSITADKVENEGEKGVNISTLAIKNHLDTKDTPFAPSKKATFAEQLNEIEPVGSFANANLAKNASIKLISPKLEMPLATKNNKITGYVNAGVGKVFYGSPNDNARYAWNRLGIGTVSAINDSADVFTLETPREINNLQAYNVTNVQIAILNYDEYVGGGIEYKISKLFGFSGGLNLHHQRVKNVQLPLDYVQDYKPAIFNTRDNWFKNKNSSFFTKNGTEISNIQVENTDYFVLAVPCMANFHLPIKRSTITASLGSSYRKLIQLARNAKLETPSKALSATSTSKAIAEPSYRNNNLTLNVRVEYQYQLSPKNAFFTALNAQWFAQTTYNSAESSQRIPRILGMETGMKF